MSDPNQKPDRFPLLPPSITPESMKQLSEEVKASRQRRAAALSRVGFHETVDKLERVIQQLDFARNNIVDFHCEEIALAQMADARKLVIELLGIDQE